MYEKSEFDKLGDKIREQVYIYIKTEPEGFKPEPLIAVEYVAKKLNMPFMTVVEHLLIDKIFWDYGFQIRIENDKKFKDMENKISVFENQNIKIFKDKSYKGETVKIKIGKCKTCGKMIPDPSTINL